MKNFLFLLITISFLTINGQELPPIETFTASDYNADNQNWMVSQASNNYIYVANSKGLLEYNGATWQTYLSPNNTILRAVNVIEDKIYTGCYEEFGYWTKNNLGKLEYTSLVPKLKGKKLFEVQIWNIINYDKWVLFQSSHELFFYHKKDETIKIITSDNIIYKTFNIDERIYYHVANEGIYTLEEGLSKLVTDDNVILNDRVINISTHNGHLLILTRKTGFYEFVDDQLKAWDKPINDTLKKLNIFNSIQLSDGSFAIGTISNGFVKVGKSGILEYIINQKRGLANNTVLALFEDNNHNVWAGLDNGINCVNVNSPIRTFTDYNGDLGTVYSTVIFGDNLYVGTNQGLFFKQLNVTDDQFKFIQGTSGQVYSLYNHKNQFLFCGHHLGTFLIKDDKAEKISSILGSWNFKNIPDNPKLILQGNYDGLYILENKNNTWELKHKIEGFKNSSRFFEIGRNNEVLVNHEYKGIFSLKLDDSLKRAIDVKLHSELPPGKNSSITTYKRSILYASKEGVFKYHKAEGLFEKDSTLTKLISSKTYTSGKMIVDQTGKLWFFSRDNISFIYSNNLTNKPEITSIPISSHLRKVVLGFENLQLVQGENYILGTANGYITVDISKINTERPQEIFLNSVNLTELNSEQKKLPIYDDGEFKHKQGILSFSYSVPEYEKFNDVWYQYRLIGLSDRWSPWSKNSEIQFENVSFGDYNLQVRAKVGNLLTNNTLEYEFTVGRPWYISNLALIVYLLLLTFLGFLIHKAYKFYYVRILKHEQMKNEKTIVQINNEKLNQEIESKNRELAISTMSIIKKNELLGKIKKELKSKSTKKESITNAIDLIDTNLNNNKDWKFFKEAFNNADKDFLDKIKTVHPDLTPNDLKFCAYLRLNLSSKEIAPLLNISTKSVETKRYRLRKRLGLSHNESLVSYILKF